MAFAARVSAPQLLQGGALLVALVGAACCVLLLVSPAQSQVPPVAPQLLAAHSENPARQWFANRPAEVEIQVSGVMAGGSGAVAILSLNQGPPRSYIAGDQLSRGVRLVAVEADGVLIERGAQRARLKVSPLPQLPAMPSLIRP